MVLTGRPALALALLVLPLLAAPRPATAVEGRLDLTTFSMITPEQWERLHRRSDSPPLTLAELKQLQAAGVGDKAILEMVRTRRVVDRASAKDLAALKKAGASDDLVAAVSAHALPENRSIDLLLTVDVSTPHSLALAPYLYVEWVQTAKGKREHLMFADLRTLLGRGKAIEDRSDPLLPSRVRRAQISGSVPLRHPGPIEVRVLVSKRPDLLRLDDLPDAERKRIKTWRFELPAVSLYHDCELELALVRDELIADVFSVQRSRFLCTFD